jgi:Mrp family chromosome partitioning ATPase
MKLSNTAHLASAGADAKAAIATALFPVQTDSAVDCGVPAAAAALIDSTGIRTIAEPVAAMARLSGHARVLIAGCRGGDGASTVAGALALELATSFAIDTLLVSGDGAFGPRSTEGRAGGNGRPVRISQSARANLWSFAGGDRDDAADELRQMMGQYRAAVVDLGVLRLDARMLAAARPDDPVLVVARYGCTRRDELAATVAIVKLAKCRLGGVILNGYETPAIDRLHWLPGWGRDPK